VPRTRLLSDPEQFCSVSHSQMGPLLPPYFLPCAAVWVARAAPALDIGTAAGLPASLASFTPRDQTGTQPATRMPSSTDPSPLSLCGPLVARTDSLPCQSIQMTPSDGVQASALRSGPRFVPQGPQTQLTLALVLLSMLPEPKTPPGNGWPASQHSALLRQPSMASTAFDGGAGQIKGWAKLPVRDAPGWRSAHAGRCHCRRQTGRRTAHLNR
jgi:hypothetical protein